MIHFFNFEYIKQSIEIQWLLVNIQFRGFRERYAKRFYLRNMLKCFCHITDPNPDMNIFQSLEGPHHYHIADHGGLVVAVPKEETPKIVRFSTDEGRCWHQFTYTDEDIIFTGICIFLLNNQSAQIYIFKVSKI